MRYRPKLDRNQTEIKAALESAGCVVQSLAALGGGVPDLLVCKHGRAVLLEIKDGAKPPSRRELTAEQSAWFQRWFLRGGCPIRVVIDIEGALDIAAKL